MTACAAAGAQAFTAALDRFLQRGEQATVALQVSLCMERSYRLPIMVSYGCDRATYIPHRFVFALIAASLDVHILRLWRLSECP